MNNEGKFKSKPKWMMKMLKVKKKSNKNKVIQKENTMI